MKTIVVASVPSGTPFSNRKSGKTAAWPSPASRYGWERSQILNLHEELNPCRDGVVARPPHW